MTLESKLDSIGKTLIDIKEVLEKLTVIPSAVPTVTPKKVEPVIPSVVPPAPKKLEPVEVNTAMRVPPPPPPAVKLVETPKFELTIDDLNNALLEQMVRIGDDKTPIDNIIKKHGVTSLSQLDPSKYDTVLSDVVEYADNFVKV